MAIFRKIHTSFWGDSFVSNLDRDKKLFYIYLLTNDKTTQCGVYEITKKQIAYDLGYTIDTVSNMLALFVKAGKIKYNDRTNEIAIKNWLKYNSSTSPKVQACINKEFKGVKDTLLIQYVSSIDTETQEEQEQEQEQEEEYMCEFYPFEEFWSDYGKKVGLKKCEAKWKLISKTDRIKIKSHLAEYTKSTPVLKFRKDPSTYLNGQCWNDLIIPLSTNDTPDILGYNESYVNGVRMFNRCVPIPKGTPPCPSNMYHWNNLKKEWVYGN